MKDLAIYIHWPFCKKKCPYCDFNSHVRETIDTNRWLKNYLVEIEYFKNLIASRRIKSIFFGGGTPSLMPAYIIETILNKINAISNINDIEVTLEANPTSSEAQKFKEFKFVGINRVSIGVQSFNSKDLKFLGREHNVTEAIKTIEIADKFFDNYSIDLIYSRPRQTLKEWDAELKEILKYVKNHISLYQLTIEKGTEFYSQYRKGKFKMPNQDLSIAIYKKTQEMLLEHGLVRYEISNYAKAGKECKHNLHYWHYNEYLGIGPGAHSRLSLDQNKLSALMMIHNPEKWLNNVAKERHGIQHKKDLFIEEIVTEYLLMGLRLETGINLKDFKQKFMKPLVEFINKEKLDFYIKKHLIIYDQQNLKFTDRGKMLLNYLISELLLV